MCHMNTCQVIMWSVTSDIAWQCFSYSSGLLLPLQQAEFAYTASGSYHLMPLRTAKRNRCIMSSAFCNIASESLVPRLYFRDVVLGLGPTALVKQRVTVLVDDLQHSQLHCTHTCRPVIFVQFLGTVCHCATVPGTRLFQIKSRDPYGPCYNCCLMP